MGTLPALWDDPVKTVNTDGEILVTTTSVEKLELQHLSTKELLQRILLELRKVNIHLQVGSEEEVLEDDLEGRDL